MKKLMKKNDSIIRILDERNDKVFVIDCIKKTMPKWEVISVYEDYVECSEEELFERTNMEFERELNKEENCIAHQRFTMIAGILPFVSDVKKRNEMIDILSKDISKQTLRKYLILYLVYQELAVLAPIKKEEKPLTQDEKNMRYALNKYFYNKDKNSLQTAYTMMLKDKYTDEMGNLFSEFPQFHQFRYFYRKSRKMQQFYITREGLREYQKNRRTLLGDGVVQYSPIVGKGFFDATICDIYICNDCGQVIGRPILTACCDAYSGMVLGYALTWEGGVYSLRKLLVNMISDKKQWCKKHGIIIDDRAWNCNQLPATFVTDRGKEYLSQNLENIISLGITIENLPPFRPELKSKIEKLFDLIQMSYKKHLHGYGVVESDFEKRGGEDYRKQACITLEEFERIIINCIIYYNSQRIIKDFPYTEEMLEANVRPYACDIFAWAKENVGSDLIDVNMETLVKIMLPRVTATFTRQGLKVNGLRYKNMDYIEEFLKGGKCEVAYDPDDVSQVWLIKNKEYVPFDLIESRFHGKSLDVVKEMNDKKKALVRAEERENLQAQIDLADKIQVIKQRSQKSDVNLKGIRETRKKETIRTHIDFMKMEEANE